MQDKGFNSFASNMINLSVNETKWSILLAGPALLFFLFRFEYLISGPKSYRDFRETGPSPCIASHLLDPHLVDFFLSVIEDKSLSIAIKRARRALLRSRSDPGG